MVKGLLLHGIHILIKRVALNSLRPVLFIGWSNINSLANQRPYGYIKKAYVDAREEAITKLEPSKALRDDCKKKQGRLTDGLRIRIVRFELTPFFHTIAHGTIKQSR